MKKEREEQIKKGKGRKEGNERRKKEDRKEVREGLNVMWKRKDKRYE